MRSSFIYSGNLISNFTGARKKLEKVSSVHACTAPQGKLETTVTLVCVAGPYIKRITIL